MSPSKDWERVLQRAAATTYAFESARPAQGMPSDAAGGPRARSRLGRHRHRRRLRRQDVKGKAVLIQDIPLPGDIRHSRATSMASSRARSSKRRGRRRHRCSASPTTSRSGRDTAATARLQRRLRRRQDASRRCSAQGQPVKVKLKMTSEMKSGLKTASVLGTLPGAPTDRGHHDLRAHGRLLPVRRSTTRRAWPCMMGLLEHFAKVPQAQRRRKHPVRRVPPAITAVRARDGSTTTSDTALGEDRARDQPRTRRRRCARSTGATSCA